MIDTFLLRRSQLTEHLFDALPLRVTQFLESTLNALGRMLAFVTDLADKFFDSVQRRRRCRGVLYGVVELEKLALNLRKRIGQTFPHLAPLLVEVGARHGAFFDETIDALHNGALLARRVTDRLTDRIRTRVDLLTHALDRIFEHVAARLRWRRGHVHDLTRLDLFVILSSILSSFSGIHGF